MGLTKQNILHLIHKNCGILFPVPSESFRSVFQRQTIVVYILLWILKDLKEHNVTLLILVTNGTKIYLSIFFNCRRLFKI